jgi:putative oxidoreductase
MKDTTIPGRFPRLLLGPAGERSGIALLVARVAVGVLFVLAGFSKLRDLGDATSSFAALGIPRPELMAPFVGAVEVVGGAMLVLGLLTRLAAVPLAIVLVVALATAKAHEMTSVKGFLSIYDVPYLLLLVVFTAVGGGRYAIDALLSTGFGKRRVQSTVEPSPFARPSSA